MITIEHNQEQTSHWCLLVTSSRGVFDELNKLESLFFSFCIFCVYSIEFADATRRQPVNKLLRSSRLHGVLSHTLTCVDVACIQTPTSYRCINPTVETTPCGRLWGHCCLLLNKIVCLVQTWSHPHLTKTALDNTVDFLLILCFSRSVLETQLLLCAWSPKPKTTFHNTILSLRTYHI